VNGEGELTPLSANYGLCEHFWRVIGAFCSWVFISYCFLCINFYWYD
jgi:hypothetical protein